jgi:uncharacterized membrane protein
MHLDSVPGSFALVAFGLSNLAPLIIVHGFADSLSAIVIYARVVRIT